MRERRCARSRVAGALTVETKYDAIVVGSGITGGWAAKELTERGLTVLMLERGHPIEHGKDYLGEHRNPWEDTFRGKGDRKRFEEHHPIVAKGAPYSLKEGNAHFWIDEKENPYVSDPERPFHWFRSGGLGGRSLLWSRQTYRLSDLDFEANAKDGHGVDWPIRYADIAPWYDHVEDFIGVSGQPEGLAQLPDGKFLPPMELNCVEQHCREKIAESFPGRVLTIGRVAVLTRAHRGRAACHYCGPCFMGCSTGSYFSTQSSTLPAARATGRLDVRTDTVVEGIDFDPETKRATAVRVIDAKTKAREKIPARVVFLCASTVGTTQILLHSRSEDAPNGLANSSGTLGKYLMDHHLGMSALGLMPGFDDREPYGNRPNGVYLARFRNLDGATEEELPFVRGYGYQGGARRAGWPMGNSMPGFGRTLKESLRKPGPWVVYLAGFGECLPSEANQVTLDETRVDRFGIPLVRTSFAWSDNERKMREDMAEEAGKMIAASGGAVLQKAADMSTPGDGIHEMGTARMGRDPNTSVLNAHNQAHDVANLFVTDGSCMASSGCQNPSLTYMALTARACAHVADRLRNDAI